MHSGLAINAKSLRIAFRLSSLQGANNIIICSSSLADG